MVPGQEDGAKGQGSLRRNQGLASVGPQRMRMAVWSKANGAGASPAPVREGAARVVAVRCPARVRTQRTGAHAPGRWLSHGGNGLRFPEIFRAAARKGAELFFLPNGGSGYGELVGDDGDQTEQVKAHVEEVMYLLQARAVDNGLYVFFANQAGLSGRSGFPGYCLAVDPSGRLLGAHTTGGEGMIVVEVSKRAVEEAKKNPRCTVGEIRLDVYENPTIVRGLTEKKKTFRNKE